MLAKAIVIEADEVVIDLEDAVAVSAKGGAREAAVAALAEPGWRTGAVSVRINAPRSAWCHLDAHALASSLPQPATLVVPKVESGGDLAFLDRLLDGAEAAGGPRHRTVRVQALIETAAGVSRIEEIAASSERLDSLILGYADLAASLGRADAGTAEMDLWLPAQSAVLIAARANGLQAIDGPYLGIEADEDFRAAACRARDLGFDGKWAIHPSQVDPLNEIFAPDPEELARARTLIAALDDAERESGHGSVSVDGQMVDEAVRLAAERLIARGGGAGGE